MLYAGRWNSQDHHNCSSWKIQEHSLSGKNIKNTVLQSRTPAAEILQQGVLVYTSICTINWFAVNWICSTGVGTGGTGSVRMASCACSLMLAIPSAMLDASAFISGKSIRSNRSKPSSSVVTTNGYTALCGCAVKRSPRIIVQSWIYHYTLSRNKNS